MTQFDSSTRNHSVTDEELGRLIREAGPRPDLSDVDFAPIRAAAHSEWKRRFEPSRPGLRSRGLPRLLALAATLTLVIVSGWWWQSSLPPAGPAVLATVQRVAGELSIVSGSGQDRRHGVSISAGDSLVSGDEVTTADGDSPSGAAIQLSTGHSLRLDAGTHLRLVSRSRLELVNGALYVDSGSSPRGGEGAIEVGTAFGTVREVGTQYEVRIDETTGSALRVRVREGEVVVDSGEESVSALRGEELEIEADGSVARGVAAVFGVTWDWVLGTSPGVEIEGMTLLEFLGWLGRETGWSIQYADEVLRTTAAQVVLHGTIEGLPPDQAAEQVVLPSSGLGYRLEEDGTLLVFRK